MFHWLADTWGRIVVLAFLPGMLFAQTVTLSGYVRDARTGEVLIGASVVNVRYHAGAVTNTYGFYSLTLPRTDSLSLVFTMTGYQTQLRAVAGQTSRPLDIFLVEATRQLDEVIVSSALTDRNVVAPQMGVIDVPLRLVKTLPAVLGERDVLKTIQLLPGVQAGQEATAGFFVRGGSTDQNLVLLDEATVYNPSHLFGLFSSFNVNALKNVTLPESSEQLVTDSAYQGFLCTYEYFYRGRVLVQANASYRLTVQYAGQTHTATATTNLPVVPLGSVEYVATFSDVYGEHEGLVLNFRDAGAPNTYYRYAMARLIDSSARDATKMKSPCLGATPVRVVELGRTLFPSRNTPGGPLTIVAEPAYKHKKGDVGYVQLQTMDEACFSFYDQLDRQKLAQYNPFVEPVFLKPTQFTGAIGVFGAYATSDSVRFVYPE